MLLNAGAALVAAGAVESIIDGIDRAALTIDAGLASELLAGLREERRIADAARAAAEAAAAAARGCARMTVAERPKTNPPNVVHEIAERRHKDVQRALEKLGRDGLRRALAAAPEPRPIVDALAAPGLHLIAEVKRRSPSAGDIAASDNAVARARAYAAGGAAAISVLCEPHWFGGSIDDLQAVHDEVAVPVLAKDFVVDPRQLDLLRAAGADLVLLLAVLHPPTRLARLAAQARDLGLEPLIEAHDAGEIEAALAAEARLVGVNNRDLQTLEVDPEQAIRLRELIPGDRLAIAESGVRDAATIARWRATGYDAALVGEALMRSPDPAAAARSFVAAGRDPIDIAAAARAPFVKICGVTDAAGSWPPSAPAPTPSASTSRPARRAPSRSRRGRARDARPGRRHRRSTGPADRARDRRPARRPARRVVASVDPDAIQLNGDEPARPSRGLGRPAWKAIRVGSHDDPEAVISLARTYLDAGAERILLDAAGGPHPGGTGVRIDAGLAAAVAREVPITLAGGLHAGNVAAAVLAIPAVGVDVASGTDAPRVDGQRPHKDPLRVALFTKRARDARRHRPNAPFGPTPVHAGLLEVDGAGRWGKERDFGGRYVPETLMAALEQLEAAYAAVRHDPRFWAELDDLLARYVGRPTPLYRADRLAADAVARRALQARERGGKVAPDPGCPPLPQARGPRPHRRPQDQQRAGAGAAHPAAGQEPGHRRDRRRPARRRDGDGVRAARPAVRRVHGRGGHPAPGAERAPDARPGRRGPLGHLRHGHPQGRGQRGDARLGHERRDDALRARVRDGPASLPDDRPRPPAPDRRRGGGPAVQPSRGGCRTSRSPASAAGPTRSACCPGSSASPRSGSRSPRPRATASRPAATRRRSPAGRRASSTARGR